MPFPTYSAEIGHKLIDAYFSSDMDGAQLVKHQTQSYDDFISSKIESVIECLNPVEASDGFCPELGRNRNTLSIRFSNPNLAMPVISEKDGSNKVMVPNDARLRNMTYSSVLTVDADVILRTFSVDQNDYVMSSRHITGISLGRIPLMVRSKYCMLSRQPAPVPVDECRYDYGGYFVVNGNEKVIISQDRIAENRTYIFTNTAKSASSYSHTAEVRSVSHSRFTAPKTTLLKLTRRSDQYGRCIRVSMHHIRSEIPLFIVFRALGVESDHAILRHVVRDESDSNFGMIADALAGCMADAERVHSQHDAINYMSQYITSSNGSSFLQSILANDVFPHVGTCFKKKALYLGYMTCRLIRCLLGIQQMDDRDSYVNKRLDTAGVLLANLFRQHYCKVVKDLRASLQTLLKGDFRATRIISSITRTFLLKAVKGNVIEAGLKHGLSTGNWGIKTTRVRQGVAQVLNRMTYVSTLSHMRRVNTAIEKTGKLVQPRKLHPSQWGVVCPSETPEGASVGLVKNLALMAHISIASPPSLVRQAMIENGTMPFDGDLSIFQSGSGVVMLNGDLVGAHTSPEILVQRLRTLKRAGVLNSTLGISWDILNNEVIVCTEGGRFCRPLLVVDVDTQTLALQRIGSWSDMILSGAIEYVDVEESNWLLIALDPAKDLVPGRTRYTHAEILPSTMLGVVAGSIPFADHNQAPRNTYQSAMGKQEVGVFATTFRHRMDTMSLILDYPERPLVSTHTARLVKCDDLPCGVNVIVAIACFTGFNQEDSVIMSRSAVDRGLFSTTFYRTFREQNSKNHSTGEEEFFCKPSALTTRDIKPHNYDRLEESGFVTEGTFVEPWDVIIGKCMPQKQGGVVVNKDVSVVLKSNERGVVDRNCHSDRFFTNTTGDGYSFAKVRMRSERIPTIGDKVSCYTSDHDILTENGWKSVSDIDRKVRVATLCENVTVYQYPSVVQHYRKYSGDLIEFCRIAGSLSYGRGPVLRVTPEHRIYIRDTSSEEKGWIVVRADSIEPSSMVTMMLDDGEVIDLFCRRITEFQGAVHCVTVPKGLGLVCVRLHTTAIWCGNSRAGQKGTIGMLYSEEDMPFTESGIVPSIIMNPHAIPSRMTVGQLMEALESKVCAMKGRPLGDASSFNGRTVDDIAAELEELGMSRHGDEVMYNPRTGERVPTLIFICPTYYQRLKHMVVDKIHCVTGDHEVLTKGGVWQRIDTLNTDTAIATLSCEDDILVYEYPTEVHTYPEYGGRLHRVRGPLVDLLVTPCHRMYVRDKVLPPGGGSERLVRCTDLDVNGSYRHRHTARFGGACKTDVKSAAESFMKDDGILPAECMDCSSDWCLEMVTILLDGGDTFDAVSHMMMSSFMRLCIHAGLVPVNEKDNIIKVFTEGEAASLEEDERIFELPVGSAERRGGVYCVSVPNEIFLVRRNGRVAWTGNSRAANGPVALLTRQPAEGRARDGGLRLGEMEMECIWAHGAMSFLKERFMECSDNYRVFVCNKCGMMADVNPERGIYHCRACKNITNFNEMRMPYANKLLVQEVQTMAVATRFVGEK